MKSRSITLPKFFLPCLPLLVRTGEICSFAPPPHISHSGRLFRPECSEGSLSASLPLRAKRPPPIPTSLSLQIGFSHSVRDGFNAHRTVRAQNKGGVP